eukprot:11023328-Alexandrium_andersonii.AAC.1
MPQASKTGVSIGAASRGGSEQGSLADRVARAIRLVEEVTGRYRQYYPGGGLLQPPWVVCRLGRRAT